MTVSLARTFNPADLADDLTRAPRPLLPSVEDRDAWARVGGQVPAGLRQRWQRESEAAADTALPIIPATLYLEFERSGSREGFRKPFKARRARLASLVLQEALEDAGSYLDPILDHVWAICEESSWALPAHQRELRPPAESMIDLTSAMTALDLAETVAVLGPRLPEGLAKRVYDEIDLRCLTPYLERVDHHWMFDTRRHGVNNWAAVCNAGVLGAALHLEPDAARLGRLAQRALRSLDDYLATFTADGGSSEGPGYWTYGFGYFTLLADLLRRASEGAVDLFALPGSPLPDIARFPLRTMLDEHGHVTFSDADRRVRFWRAHLAHLGRTLADPELLGMARVEPPRTGEYDAAEHDTARALRDALWDGPDVEAATPYAPGPHDWLPDLQWMMARHRPAAGPSLMLAAKGGHNAEMHNHNDVGTFLLHVDGEPLLPDLGKGLYTKAYHGPDRYQLLVRSSLGHSVPVVDGHPQGPARFDMKGDAWRYHARVLEHAHDDDADRLVLDLTRAYPAEAGLASLRRTLTLDRAHGRVEVRDAFAFEERPRAFTSVLVTREAVTIDGAEARICGPRAALRAVCDGAEALTVDEREDVAFPEGPATVRRIEAAHPPAISGEVAWTLIPEAPGEDAA